MKLDWRQSILFITIIGMEGCWIHTSMALLNRQVAQDRLSTLGILLLLPVSFVFNMLLRRLSWPKICHFIVSWLGWVAAMLLIIKIQVFGNLAVSDLSWLSAVPRAITEVIYSFNPALLILVSTAIIWWLGRRLVYLKTDFSRLITEFQFGLAILLVALFSASMLKTDIDGSVPVAMAFFSFALLGISISHAQENSGWLSRLYQGHWTGLLLASIIFILILGLIAGLIINPDLLKLVLTGLKWVWGRILDFINFIMSLLPEPEPGELPPAMPMPTPNTEPPEELKLWSMPESVRNGLRLLLNILWAGLLLFALWRISSQIFSWLRRKMGDMAGAEFEPLPGAFRTDFLRLLKRILAKLLGLRSPFRTAGKPKPVLPEVASVRQVYRQLLRWAASGGCVRQSAQTPHEYLYALAELLPEASDDLELITQQYIRTRYSTFLPTEGELDRLNQSWYRVRKNRWKNRRQE